MVSNPSSRLESRLEEEGRREVFYRELRPRQSLESFEYLIYIKCQDFIERYSIATVQVCNSDAEATRHWDTQTRHDEKVFIHPQRCRKIKEGTYWLIFPKVIRHIKVWMDEHTKGQVTDEAMWNILSKVGQHMTYLVEVNRAHGNLFQGIGVTTDFQPLFLNLGRETGPLIYQSDAKALRDEILEKVKLRDKDSQKHVENWWSFLSMSCADTSPPFLPHDYTGDHLKFVFNYPISWDSNNKLRFLANIYQLCTTDDPQSQYNLLNHPTFEASLQQHYWNWPAELTHGALALNEVCLFGSSKGIYREVYDSHTSQMVLSPASIVIFAHNYVRHRHMEAQNYNKVHGVRLREMEASNILIELYIRFPSLIERIYEAFYIAVVFGGYSHSKFPIGDILTGRL